MNMNRGKNHALTFIDLSAKSGDVVERMWDVMNRRVMNMRARMVKRVNVLMAHIRRLEKMNGERATTIAHLKSDKRTLEHQVKEAKSEINVLAARLTRRETTIKNKAECIDRLLAEIEALKNQVSNAESRCDDLEIEMRDALSRT